MLLSAMTLSACGPQAYMPTTIVSNQTAAGGVDLPPRVDIVLAVSSDGGMQNIYQGLQTELVKFTNKLQSRGWDYRFVSISMSERNELFTPAAANPAYNYDLYHKVSLSRFHTNYDSLGLWIPAYPGASNTDPFYTLSPSTMFTESLTIPSLDTTYTDGRQSGLKNQRNFVLLNSVRNQFLRADANLAVISISNGRDSSDGWTTTTSPVSFSGPTPTPEPKPKDVNVVPYVNAMATVKNNPSQLKYYSIVSHRDGDCRGQPSRKGEAYIQASTLTGGIDLDLCSNTIEASLNAVAQHIQSQPMYFKKNYLVLQSQPDQSTIKVYKNGVLLPQDATNGWTYAGNLTNQPLICYPTNLATTSGFMIKLNGTAELVGSDTSRVEYMALGAQTSQ